MCRCENLVLWFFFGNREKVDDVNEWIGVCCGVSVSLVVVL